MGEGGLYTTSGSVCGKVGNKTGKKKNREKDGGTRKTDKNINKIPAINVFLPLTNID